MPKRSLLAVLVCAPVLAACGSSAPQHSAAATTATAAPAPARSAVSSLTPPPTTTRTQPRPRPKPPAHTTTTATTTATTPSSGGFTPTPQEVAKAKQAYSQCKQENPGVTLEQLEKEAASANGIQC